jgi:hypothetical protein
MAGREQSAYEAVEALRLHCCPQISTLLPLDPNELPIPSPVSRYEHPPAKEQLVLEVPVTLTVEVSTFCVLTARYSVA